MSNGAVEQRDDYPAEMKKLRTLLIALAEAERFEAKTARAELYPKLGVQDPETATAQADSMPTLIEISSPAGDEKTDHRQGSANCGAVNDLCSSRR